VTAVVPLIWFKDVQLVSQKRLTEQADVAVIGYTCISKVPSSSPFLATDYSDLGVSYYLKSRQQDAGSTAK